MTVSSLRVDRINRGLSIRQFSQLIGVKPHVLRYAETGGRPTHENAKVIADFYECKVTDLWPLDEPARAA